MKYTYVIGVMSGTSLDGVDLAYVQFDELNNFKILKAATIPYSQKWILALKDVSLLSRSDDRLKELNIELGKYFSEILLDFIHQNKIVESVVVASHGHTVHHQPEIGYTLQIGCGKEIFKRTGLKVVYDFRSQDVRLRGQGAPLVPIGDELLFSEYDYCLNLGGFSNVSYRVDGIRKAFDVCPVNTVLNFYSNKLGFLYDDKGELAREGVVDKLLFKELNNLEFYKSTKPKSLGVEFLKKEFYPILSNYNISIQDILSTLVEHIAFQISQKIKKGSVLVTGGGAYHSFLLERIADLNSELELRVPGEELVEYKEALIFALLGKLRLEHKVNCLSSVTGALKNHSSGVVLG